MRKLFFIFLTAGLMAGSIFSILTARAQTTSSLPALSLEPASGQIFQGSNLVVEVKVTNGDAISEPLPLVGADLVLNYDPSQLTFFNLTDGPVFGADGWSLVGGSDAAGRLLVSGGIYPGSAPSTASGTFVTLDFVVEADAGSIVLLNFDFTLGKTTDTNLASAAWPGKDVLKAVTGASYTVVQGATGPYFISGRVVDNSGAGIEGVKLNAASNSSGGSAMTESNGNYTISNLPNGNYTVWPAKTGYEFTPGDSSVKIDGKNVTDVDFTGRRTTQPPGDNFSISGTISGVGIAGVTVTAGGRSVTSSADGSYTITGLVSGFYTVKPSLGGFSYKPTSRSVAVSRDVSGVNFVGSAGTTPPPVTPPPDMGIGTPPPGTGAPPGDGGGLPGGGGALPGDGEGLPGSGLPLIVYFGLAPLNAAAALIWPRLMRRRRERNY